MSQEKHLVISSYNHDVEALTKLGIPFTIYDQSDDLQHAESMKINYGALQRYNCGHSLSNMFEYIIENYDSLPRIIIFAKSNIVPRHCTKMYFEQNINNNFYTHLYHEDFPRTIPGSSDYLSPGIFLEKNNSWYSSTREHNLFCQFNELYDFLFDAGRNPEWIEFSPGACFIVESERILRYPKSFWHALNRISSYRYFPAEAYMVERLLPMVFLSSLPLQPWMHDSGSIDQKLNNLQEFPIVHCCKSNKIRSATTKLLKLLN